VSDPRPVWKSTNGRFPSRRFVCLRHNDSWLGRRPCKTGRCVISAGPGRRPRVTRKQASRQCIATPVPGNLCWSPQDGNGSWGVDGNVCFTAFYFRDGIGRLWCCPLCPHNVVAGWMGYPGGWVSSSRTKRKGYMTTLQPPVELSGYHCSPPPRLGRTPKQGCWLWYIHAGEECCRREASRH
jgi:hypothetical protein